MLVLTRRIHEGFSIGEDIFVRVLNITGRENILLRVKTPEGESRHLKEVNGRVEIADNISLVVLGIRGNRAKIAIAAPRSVVIDRT